MAGDVYIRIKIEQHSIYKRKGADLTYDKTITLLEALTGVHFELPHFENKHLYISTKAGDIVCDGILLIYTIIILKRSNQNIKRKRNAFL